MGMPQGRLPFDAVVDALEPVVEPAQLECPMVQAGPLTEVAVDVVDSLVRAGVHHDPLERNNFV